jgi:DNA-binding transcriptional MerR regulator
VRTLRNTPKRLLSIKALRLYDESSLPHPAFVDPATGYRYYLPDQAPVARAIAILRRNPSHFSGEILAPRGSQRGLLGQKDAFLAILAQLSVAGVTQRRIEFPDDSFQRGRHRLECRDWRGFVEDRQTLAQGGRGFVQHRVFEQRRMMRDVSLDTTTRARW